MNKYIEINCVSRWSFTKKHALYYIIIIAFPPQHYFHLRAAVLRHTHIAIIVIL